MGNLPNGFDEVTSTVVLVLESMINSFKNEIPGINTVYDEKLSYESAVENFRGNKNLEKENSPMYPLFAFKRSVLRYVEPGGPGRRANSIFARKDMKTNDNTSNVYRLFHGEFDVNFLFVTKEIRHLELFEIMYMSEEGISSYKELEVDLTAEIGEKFLYFADYQPLEDKLFESDNVSYKMLQGTIKIKGFYPVLRGNVKHIKEINLRIEDFLGGVYGTHQSTVL
jgi:hypothetical protein